MPSWDRSDSNSSLIRPSAVHLAQAGGEKMEERRPARRHPVMAAAEVVELKSEIRVKARTSDLSLSGCYVDTINPLPAGTEVKLLLTHRGTTVEVCGRVIHEQPYMGMGIAFSEIAPDHKAVLQEWLAGFGEAGS